MGRKCRNPISCQTHSKGFVSCCFKLQASKPQTSWSKAHGGAKADFLSPQWCLGIVDLSGLVFLGKESPHAPGPGNAPSSAGRSRGHSSARAINRDHSHSLGFR